MVGIMLGSLHTLFLHIHNNGNYYFHFTSQMTEFKRLGDLPKSAHCQCVVQPKKKKRSLTPKSTLFPPHSVHPTEN